MRVGELRRGGEPTKESYKLTARGPTNLPRALNKGEQQQLVRDAEKGLYDQVSVTDSEFSGDEEVAAKPRKSYTKRSTQNAASSTARKQNAEKERSPMLSRKT